MITLAKRISLQEEINEKYKTQQQRDFALKVLDMGYGWAAEPRPYGSYKNKRSKKILYKETLSALKERSGYSFTIFSPILSMILWEIIKYIARRILEQVFEETLDFLES